MTSFVSYTLLCAKDLETWYEAGWDSDCVWLKKFYNIFKNYLRIASAQFNPFLQPTLAILDAKGDISAFKLMGNDLKLRTYYHKNKDFVRNVYSPISNNKPSELRFKTFINADDS